MKLLRHGTAGFEKPGILDDQGRVRDLSAVVADIAVEVLLPASLDKLRRLNLNDLPLVPGVPQQNLRLGACVGQVGKCIGIGQTISLGVQGLGVQKQRTVQV
jgi:2,4-diketo-3-deoxy-L-fuconate hydrolase